jgi:hypothetical protein
MNKDIINIQVDDFNVDNINIKKIDNNKFMVQYNKKQWNFICEDKFDTYGVKNTSNVNKITIIFNNKKYHNEYKNVINNIYNKVRNTLCNKYKNIEIINPLGDKQYTLDIDIYNFKNNMSRIFEVRNNNVNLIHVNDLNRPFKICPHIFLYTLTLKDNKLYFNYVIKEAYIKFETPTISSIEYILNIFDSDNDNNEDEIQNIDDNEYLC